MAFFSRNRDFAGWTIITRHEILFLVVFVNGVWVSHSRLIQNESIFLVAMCFRWRIKAIDRRRLLSIFYADFWKDISLKHAHNETEYHPVRGQSIFFFGINFAGIKRGGVAATPSFGCLMTDARYPSGERWGISAKGARHRDYPVDRSRPTDARAPAPMQYQQH